MGGEIVNPKRDFVVLGPWQPPPGIYFPWIEKKGGR